MPNVPHGTAHVYGIPNGVAGITNATVVSDSITQAHRNTGTTINELGNKIEDRRDDRNLSGSITLRIRDAYTVAAAATAIEYNWDGTGAKWFLIESVARANTAGETTEITYNVLWDEYVDYDPA